MHTSELYDKARAVAFYQERYSSGYGYMDEWPIEKKHRVVDVIRGFGLPDEGEALDFGCGSGVFTDVLRQALPPGWKVYGTDVSKAAIDHARKRYPGCVFFLSHDRQLIDKKFDFLFTHHVLEHVYDLSHALDEINNRLKHAATMLHILPCGNEGSFEHDICRLRTEGIDSRLENRFFFEDVGHVRRLTSMGLSELCRERRFLLADESYSNQYYGAIDWITQSGSNFIRMLTDAAAAVNMDAKSTLKRYRRGLIALWHLRRVAIAVEKRLGKTPKTLRTYVGLVLMVPLYVFSKLVDLYLKQKAQDEWNTRRKERNGSEMYLCFKR
jgi:SAM-dependent methyltransferase